METKENIKRKKRKVEVLVISDVHLGTYGCHAKELLQYMKSIKPQTVILNGDIIDMWQFSKRYWPKEHMQVVQQILKWAGKGVRVHYITGNHDELLRKFVGFDMGGLVIENQLILELEGKKHWFFHGDIFDFTMQHAKWLTKLGAHGYDFLIVLNAVCNWILTKLGKEKISLSKNIKNSVKSAVKFINNFEQAAAGIAIERGYDYVVCGHIHQPVQRKIELENGDSIDYMNSGDWVEHCSALEFNNGKWELIQYKYEADQFEEEEDEKIETKDQQAIFQSLMEEFNVIPLQKKA